MISNRTLTFCAVFLCAGVILTSGKFADADEGSVPEFFGIYAAMNDGTLLELRAVRPYQVKWFQRAQEQTSYQNNDMFNALSAQSGPPRYYVQGKPSLRVGVARLKGFYVYGDYSVKDFAITAFSRPDLTSSSIVFSDSDTGPGIRMSDSYVNTKRGWTLESGFKHVERKDKLYWIQFRENVGLMDNPAVFFAVQFNDSQYWPFSIDTSEAFEPQEGSQVSATQQEEIEFEVYTPPEGESKIIELPGGVTLELLWVHAGTFTMGSTLGQNDERPPHKVTLTQGFWLGKCEVTQAQWKAVMGNNPSEFKGDDKPVEQLSWDDCQEFLNKINSQVKGETFRLPTEAEWEYACRAGTDTKFFFEDYDTDLRQHAWYSENTTQKEGPKPVGKKKPNPWGFYDMYGNVAEWCQDYYSEDYYSVSPAADPPGPPVGTARLRRGGGYLCSDELCSSVDRDRSGPDRVNAQLGFRLVASGQS